MTASFRMTATLGTMLSFFRMRENGKKGGRRGHVVGSGMLVRGRDGVAVAAAQPAKQTLEGEDERETDQAGQDQARQIHADDATAGHRADRLIVDVLEVVEAQQARQMGERALVGVANAEPLAGVFQILPEELEP